MRDEAQEKSRTLFITGASGGLGQALAQGFANRFDTLVLHGRNARRLELLKDELLQMHPGTVCYTVVGDLGREAGTLQVIEALTALPVTVTDVILNAGFSVAGPFQSLSATQISELVEVNVKSHLLLTRAFLDTLQSLIVISSSGAYQPGPFTAIYYAAKSLLNSFYFALQKENPEKQILVVCPGALDTPFQERAGKEKAPLALAPDKVACQILNAWDKKRAYLAPGAFNKAAIVFTKLLPARLNARLVFRIQMHQAAGGDVRR